MKSISLILFLNLLFIFFSSAQSLESKTLESKTEILILGTTHLKQLGKKFKPEMLDPVIAVLDKYDFDAICIENMPGQLLYDIESRHDSVFDEILDGFGGDRLVLAAEFQDKLGVNLGEAERMVTKLMERDEISDAERTRLIEYLIASADLVSATLQYTYLVEPEMIDKRIESELKKRLSSPNEIYSLASRLAKEEGLGKIEYIDNFQDEALMAKHFPEFIIDYMENQDKLSGVANSPVYQKMEELTNKAIVNKDLSDLYTYTNSIEYMEQDFKAQWELWLNTNFPSKTDISRYNLWEMRNLQIAANIMKTAAFYPGRKILVVIGSSHKLFLEKYLEDIPDIKLLNYPDRN